MKNQVYYILKKNFHFLSHKIDNPELAIKLYIQGIQELEKAVNISVDPTGKEKRH